MGLVIKNPPASEGDLRDSSSVPGLGRSLGGGHGKPLQYSCLKSPMDRGAWQATVHGVTKSCTRLSTMNTMPNVHWEDKLPLDENMELYLIKKTTWASLVAQVVKNPPVMQETPVQFLGREDPLEKG